MRSYTKCVYHGPKIKAAELERLARIFGVGQRERDKPEVEEEPKERTWRNMLCGECRHFLPDENRTRRDLDGHLGGSSEKMGNCVDGEGGVKRRVSRCEWACERFTAGRHCVGTQHARAVVCVETGEIFKSITSADKRIGHTGVAQAIDCGWKCGGYHWRYVEECTAAAEGR